MKCSHFSKNILMEVRKHVLQKDIHQENQKTLEVLIMTKLNIFYGFVIKLDKGWNICNGKHMINEEIGNFRQK